MKLEHRETGPNKKGLGTEIGSCLMVGFRIRSVECGFIITANRIIIQISVYFNVTNVRSIACGNSVPESSSLERQ
jgi:hypothetical protein